MRDYQPHKDNPYWLEPTIYKRVLTVIRDYDRMVRDYNNILAETISSDDGQPRSSSPGDPVARKVERADRLWQEIHAVEMARKCIPQEYQQGVWENVQFGGWPVDIPAHYKTWLYWRKRFLFFTAKNLKLL